jgi:hypothetical protein
LDTVPAAAGVPDDTAPGDAAPGDTEPGAWLGAFPPDGLPEHAVVARVSPSAAAMAARRAAPLRPAVFPCANPKTSRNLRNAAWIARRRGLTLDGGLGASVHYLSNEPRNDGRDWAVAGDGWPR